MLFDYDGTFGLYFVECVREFIFKCFLVDNDPILTNNVDFVFFVILDQKVHEFLGDSVSKCVVSWKAARYLVRVRFKLIG